MRGLTSMVLLCSAGSAAAQYDPFAPQRPDPRAVRAFMERAVVHAGPDSRPFVEAYGLPGAQAIAACSPDVARTMATSPRLGKLPRPSAFPPVLAQPPNCAGHQLVLFPLAHP